MSEPLPTGLIASYHAHVYYDEASTRAQAEWLREGVAERFSVRLGRWYDRPIGPHSRSMFQIAFRKPLFPTLVPWLMLNRGELSILVHPNTDNQRLDHLQRCLWLGPQLHVFGERLSEGPLEDDEQDPNTTPSLEL
jgi:DOPA 4,5-dioxygenase